MADTKVALVLWLDISDLWVRVCTA